MPPTPGLSIANAISSPFQSFFDGGVGTEPGGAVPTSVIDDRLSALNSLFIMGYPHDLPKYYFNLIISKYQRDLTSTNPQTGDPNPLASKVQINPEAVVRLPIPIGMVDNHLVDYEEQPLAQVLSGVAALSNINLLRNRFGYTPNNILTIFLKGPKYKRHQFHWRVSPKTPKEARTLNNIIRLLNNSMAPGISSKAWGAVSWFQMPKIFYPEIYPNSQYMFKFKPCVLENFVVNYTPGGQASFFRGSADTPLFDSTFNSENTGSVDGNGNAPEGMEFSMQFLELEYWLSTDFINDNNPQSTIGDRGGGAIQPRMFGPEETNPIPLSDGPQAP